MEREGEGEGERESERERERGGGYKVFDLCRDTNQAVLFSVHVTGGRRCST